jgi:branched-chain amino acid aminotransferase
MARSKYISMDGKLVPYEDARIHVLSPAAKYGANVFEGLRAYWNADQDELYVFRMREHMVRLQQGMKVMRYKAQSSIEQWEQWLLEMIRRNDHRTDCHLRFTAFVTGEGFMDAVEPVVFVATAEERAAKPLEQKAVTAQVAAWRRIDDSSMPPRVKTGANYSNARLGLLQARADGYNEAIFLTQAGKVAEGGGACVFMVRDGVPSTPLVTGGILESVTRASLISLFQSKLGTKVVERDIDRTELYAADELFFCGSAYEVTPITGVDRLPVGNSEIGPVTRALWKSFEDVVRGRDNSHPEWRAPVFGGTSARRTA